MSTGDGKLVCVTGASGFIASWLVKLLLQRGYTVRATVRNPNDPEKTKHLLDLEGAKERLHLFQADLLDEGSFDHAVEGCEGIFHTASPVFFGTSSDPQRELIDPAVKGTLNVLRACAKSASIKRVVLTSSIVSVYATGKPLTPEVIVDETWFSDPEICKDSNSWYELSKTLGEQAAWNFAKENGLDLVSLHPVVVIGPLLQPTLNFSTELLLNIMNGVENPVFKTTACPFVDVRDVGNAHIQAFENPAANGRYCLAERTVRTSDIIEIMKNLYPTLELKDDTHLQTTFQVSRERAESLGVNFIPLEVSVRDTVESLKEKGFLSF